VPLAFPVRDQIAQMIARNVVGFCDERIFFKDRDGRFLLVSAGWLAVEGPGRALDEVIGRTELEIFGSAHAASEDERRVLATGEPIIAKSERQTCEGRPDSWVSTTILPLLDEDGNIIGIRGSARDVTAEVQREEALRRHAEGQEEIADLGRLALKGAPLEELLDFAVGAAWRVLASDGARVVEFPPESSDPVVRAQVGSRHVHAHNTIGVLVGDPGAPFGVLEVSYSEPSAVPSASPAFLGALASALGEAIQNRDAQEMIKRQSESLAAMTHSLRGLVSEKERLIEKIPGVVMIFDVYPDGSRKYVYVSPRSATILGLAPAEFLEDQRCFTAHVHVEDQALRCAAISEPAAAGRDPLPTELRWLHPDGKEIWLREEAAIIHADGRCHRVQAVLFDITAAKQAESARERLELDLRLAQKLEAVGQLAAGIAHEINTPVQFIGDSIRFLKESNDELMTLTNVYHDLLHSEEPIDKAERQRRAAAAEDESDLDYLTTRVPAAFKRAMDGVERVASIVRAMRQFAHPSTERSPIDINEGIQTTLVVSRNEYKYVADIELDLGELPLVMANAGELNQVFLNLIVNAAQAIETAGPGSNERGKITLRTRADERGVLITVSDSGCGIPAEIADRIFDPFFTTKPVGHGTGQGLALAHTIIVERHYGTITFEPTPGGGTTFRILLPLNHNEADTG
jgi:PAS domain S-box-containing protein